MLKKYMPHLVSIFFYVVVILGVNLVLIFLYRAISGAGIFEVPAYFRMLSDVLFAEGSLAFTIGAFLEFFAKGLSRSIGRSMILPCKILSKRLALKEITVEEEYPGGWTLVFIGAFIIVLSAIFAIIFAK